VERWTVFNHSKSKVFLQIGHFVCLAADRTLWHHACVGAAQLHACTSGPSLWWDDAHIVQTCFWVSATGSVCQNAGFRSGIRVGAVASLSVAGELPALAACVDPAMLSVSEAGAPDGSQRMLAAYLVSASAVIQVRTLSVNAIGALAGAPRMPGAN
jgi:hypothetical protein